MYVKCFIFVLQMKTHHSPTSSLLWACLDLKIEMYINKDANVTKQYFQ